MAINVSLEATKNALAEQHHQVRILAVKCNKLALELEQAKAIIKRRAITIDVKEQEGWELQMQCEYKAKELQEMTLGWDKTKEKLEAMETELEEARYAEECWKHNYLLKEQELLTWRINAVATVRSLQRRIEELERGRNREGEERDGEVGEGSC